VVGIIAKLFTFVFFFGKALSAGRYAGRVSMRDARHLRITNMQIEDAGTFECDVTFPGSITSYQYTEDLSSVVSDDLTSFI